MTDRGGRDRSELHGVCNGDHGIDASAEFRAYQERLRSTWPANPELAAKYGVSTVNGRSIEINMNESTTGETGEQYNTEMGRRAFCVGAATTIALAGAGGVAASGGQLNYPSDYVPNPFLSATTTIGTHKPEFSALEYENDEGEPEELPAVIDDRAPDDPQETTANVFSMRADRIDASDYRAFPVGLEQENADGDLEPVTAVDPDEWTTDGGSISVAEGETEIDSVNFSASPADGATTTATFDASGELEKEADPRQYLQLGVNVNGITSGAVVEIALEDADGEQVVVSIDPAADETENDVVATATGSGIIYQEQLGELPNESAVDEIVAVTVSVSDADADVTVYALNAERKSRWEFGSMVVDENTDDETTETIREPSGTFTTTGLSGELVDSATIHDLDVPVRYDAAHAKVATSHEETTTDRYPAFDALSETHARIEVPTAYDLGHSDLELEMHQQLPDDRYNVLEVAEGTSDTDDADVDGSDVRGSLASEGDYVTLEEFAATGTEYSVIAELKLTSDELDQVIASGGAGGGPLGSSGGGMFSGARGLVLAVAAAGASYFGFIRQRLPW